MPGSPAPPEPFPASVLDELAAIADSLSEQGVTSRLTRLGGTPVLTIDEPAAGPDFATVAIDPDTSSGSGLRLDCTCIWTPASGATPKATADTIVAVLNAVARGTRQDSPGCEADWMSAEGSAASSHQVTLPVGS